MILACSDALSDWNLIAGCDTVLEGLGGAVSKALSAAAEVFLT
jgi:hypothetical protein